MQRDVLLLGEMIDAAEQIRVLTNDLPEVADLETDRLRRDALLWNFTVLGEAASQLSDRVVKEHPALAWHRPAQLRNRIVQGYWSIDLGILIETARDDLPGFVDQMRQIRAAIGELNE
jgi:uncharacterized protein with HEPN domain